jgi:hypothetical protein
VLVIAILPNLLPKVGIIPGNVGIDINPNILLWELVPWIVGLIATIVFLPYIMIASFREQARRNTILANEIKKQLTVDLPQIFSFT